MDRLQRDTIEKLTRQLASFRWGEAEIRELVDPQMGVITSFQDLLESLDRLRRVDLGDVPPADCSVRSASDQ
ncbi:hypothetical protein [Aquibaculum arenosum]|uniref:Uncharacterized protein n=1 Tax=Aquibaculum arenosum TaxID=3032591 RepID=A0ABT5YMG5_9PROT|nr:hypothetical protein [Fodinicurvata sp. CAU 1616]MDF2096124.1 hypothetical protein [Fodinicurvata sp. CAU 1616]